MARMTIKRAATLLTAALFVLAAEASASFDYGGAFDKSLQFLEAQRSGKLPADRRVHWRGDSALTDGFSQGVDLVGGYYDSGDHVKFGFPMAYAVTMLSWGVLEFEKEMAAANNLNRALDAIRWGADYFLKAHSEPNSLWVQVGDGESDHLCWERAEDMSTPRTAFKIDAAHPGSDVAAETSAALAAASKAIRPYDSEYADRLIMHAKQLFAFADTFRGRYDDAVPGAKKFYPSASGYQDELLWAAAWLYEATGHEAHLRYVAQNANALGGTGWAVREFSWDNKYAGLQVLLSKLLLTGGGGANGLTDDYDDTLHQLNAKAEFFLCACLQKNGGNNVRTTPAGLLYVADWNNMQYVTSSAFLLAVYADYLAVSGRQLKCPDGEVSPSEMIRFVRRQVDYVLGDNPASMSYMVGYGENFPRRVHHRGASIPAVGSVNGIVGCMDGFDRFYNMKEADPNVVYGALVGGPDANDVFVDDRCNYQRAEPTIATAAPIVGVFARLAAEPTTAEPATASGDGSSSYHPAVEAPLEFVHTVTATWKGSNGEDEYRHEVTAKNTCGQTITYVKLHVKGLSGPIYGASASAQGKDMYEWVGRLGAGEKLTIVYVQGGPPAKIAVADYKTG